MTEAPVAAANIVAELRAAMASAVADDVSQPLSEARKRHVARLVAVTNAITLLSSPADDLAVTVEARAALGMIRQAIEDLFGPSASLESEEAVLLRGPGLRHEAEAIVDALKRLARE